MKIHKNKNTEKWDLDFHCNNRRIWKRGFLSSADAENYKTKLEYNLKFKKHGLPKEEKIRFIELAKKYLENYSKPNKSSFKTDIALAKPLVEHFGSTNARYAKALMERQQKLVEGFEVSGEIGEVVNLNQKKIVSK